MSTSITTALLKDALLGKKKKKSSIFFFFPASVFFTWDKVSELHQAKSFPLESRPYYGEGSGLVSQWLLSLLG